MKLTLYNWLFMRYFSERKSTAKKIQELKSLKEPLIH
jgi:hypothetical protein